MIRIFLVTNVFPYFNGEQFLETEIEYYSTFNNIKLVVLPLSKLNDEKRVIPKNVVLDNYLLQNKITKNKKILALVKLAFSSSLFYKELFNINIFNVEKVKIFLSSIANFEIYRVLFSKFCVENNISKECIFYTYWHQEPAYALQYIKKNFHFKLVSRIHEQDIYKEHKKCLYMPLKKYFTKEIDKIFTITKSANSYLAREYGFLSDTIELSSLGVKDHKQKSNPTKANTYHILSCSYITEQKQIHKIIQALDILSRKINHNILWTHIGDGDLSKKIQDIAAKRLTNKNIEFNFTGMLSNEDVCKFYENHEIDVFVNSSKTEGVPVSIMEAMSYSIPIIAPNIGGIEDMLENGYNGIMLKKDFAINELCEAFINIDFFKNQKTRLNSYEKFKNHYDADKNYMEFIKKLIKL